MLEQNRKHVEERATRGIPPFAPGTQKTTQIADFQTPAKGVEIS